MRRSAPPADPGAREADAGAVRITYLGGNVIQIRGPFTGRSYAFSPHARVQWVDAADSRTLLRSRFFRVTTEPG